MRRVDPDAEAARLAEERKRPFLAGIKQDDILMITTSAGVVRARVVAVTENWPEVVLHAVRDDG
jgi:hypothetical protein